ncbi:MAG: hypothetical protein SGI77_09300 [Pirellulaceae bacterium]|nr:hypothetical protein [Pirellulaceae bacterium]
MTQEFFTRLLEKQWLTAVTRESGRFRSFLLMTMKRFMANEWHRSRTQKRGCGVRLISFDAETAESYYAVHAATTLPAEMLFEKRWALTLLETVVERLQAEFATAGKSAEFERLKPCLTAEQGNIAYEELAEALQITPASARSAVHRLRKRFRAIFRDEVAGTIDDPAELDDEMRAVIAALSQA